MLEYAGVIGLILGVFGLLYGVYQTRKYGAIFEEYRPAIQRAMSILGAKGKQKQVDTALQEEVEDALTNGVIKMIAAKYPEAGVLLAYLESEQPEIFQKIKDNPELVIGLYQKFAPLIMKILGGRQPPQQTQGTSAKDPECEL